MTPFWMVWRAGKQRTPAVKHDTLIAAVSEADRLAAKHPDVTFYVLEAVADVAKPAVPATKAARPGSPRSGTSG